MLLVSAACIVTTLAIAGASLVLIFERQVLDMIGRDLDVRWADIARDLTVDRLGEPQLAQTFRDSRYRQAGAYWQLFDGDEAALSSPSLRGRTLDLSSAEAERTPGSWFEIDDVDGQELYVVERSVTAGPPGSARSFRLAVALDHEQVESARSAFGWDVALVLGLIALLLVAAAWLQLRVILGPLGRVRSQLAAIRDGRQSRLEGGAPAEIAPLADDLNRLLDGQEQLVRKARERAGSLAHGLKTPLAILGAETRRLDGEGQTELARRMREQVSAIQTHVEREIARARSNAASAGLGSHVDAAAAADRLLRVMRRMPRGEDLVWRFEGADGLMLRMDSDDFGEILGNLLDNSRKWATGAVTLRFENAAASARIVVEDDGPGFGSNAAPPTLTASDRENSAGLGLVIVQDILATYGSALWIDRAAQNGVVSFTLPIASPSAGQGRESGRDAAVGGERWSPAPKTAAAN